jgi:leucine dehydrogenase
MKLARLLHAAGASLFVADLDPAKVRAAEAEFGAATVAVEEIVAQSVDIFAPCALGDAVDVENVDRLAARVVAGAANNVFSSTDVADALQSRGVVYAVDFIANAGGIIYDDQLRARPSKRPLDEARARSYVDGIFDRTLRVFALSAEFGIPYWEAALRLAEENLRGPANQ